MKIQLSYFCFIALLIFASCQNQKQGNAQSENQPEIKSEVKEIPETIVEPLGEIKDTVSELPPIKLKDDYNDIALFLSGQKLNKKSPYFELTKDSSFIKYAKSVKNNYTKYNDKQLSKIKTWSEKELGAIHAESKDVFYPFSGPDILHASTVFPNADNYYLFGLEPVGEIPDLQNISLDSIDRLFSALNKSISDNFSLSFFITKKMYKDLNSEYIKGTIPILLFFLSKMNYHIQDIKPVKIMDDGTLEFKERSVKSNFANFGKGVEITFIDTSSNQLKKVYYFSMDISDTGFKKQLGMQNFINSFTTPVTTLVKSASYCLHAAKYNTIRSIILDKTKYLLQDDTGIPFSYFNEKCWDISLFGTYEKPVKVFLDHYQADFKKAMDEKAKPVDFRFGYTKEANIFLGIRK